MKMNYVIKRDGTTVPFNKEKIVAAIEKAMAETEQGIDHVAASAIADRVTDSVSLTKNITVEEIQDIVESDLMESNRRDAAKAYICYRYLHSMSRNQYEKLMETVSEKLGAENVQNQNANMDEHSFGGRIGEATNAIMKQYALDYCMSDLTKRNHENNEIYVHDLDRYAVGMHNCLTCPIDKLLSNGFNTRQTDVRPAQSVNTAFQLVAVIFQLQSLMQFGGVSASHLDWTMVPYVRKSFYKHFRDGMKYLHGVENFYVERPEDTSIKCEDYSNIPDAYRYAMDMTERETRQAVEGMYHNLKIWATCQ